jgi:hypothetical protein
MDALGMTMPSISEDKATLESGRGLPVQIAQSPAARGRLRIADLLNDTKTSK